MKIKTPTSIRCRGNMLKVYGIRNSRSMTISHFDGATLYLSDCEPIAIRYENDATSPIMTFKMCGENSVNDKIELRKVSNYATVMPKEFDNALMKLFT